ASEDSPETAAIYIEKQRSEPDPAEDVESREWIEHYLGLAEGILLDNENATQGERDFLVFELWVNGFTPTEIAEREEVSWLKERKSVDASLRRSIHKLWAFFGVNPEKTPMVTGSYAGDKDATRAGKTS